jgi:hypothetical protein
VCIFLKKIFNMKYLSKLASVISLVVLTSCGGGGGGSGGTTSAPVAVAPAVYAVGPYVMIDGSQSYDPKNKTLTYNWAIQNPPAGWGTTWGGFVDQNNDKGTVAFYTYQQDGNYRGTLNFILTVNNGSEVSSPLVVPVTVCCSSTENVAAAVDFVAKLPVYTIDKIKSLYSSYGVTGWSSAFKFAASYGLNYPQLDFLKGVAAGTSLTEWRNNGPQNPYIAMNGGATITGYSLDIPDAVSVPSDLSQVKYPDDFLVAKATTANVQDPYCNSNPINNIFLASDLGGYSLPRINVSPLPSGVLKMANIKDIWDIINPSIAESCTKDVSVAWNVTFDRLIKVGVNAIAITPWSFLYASNQNWRLPIAGADPRVSQMTDADVRWIVGLAKARGFKVYWVNQIQGVIKADGSYLTESETTVEHVQKAVAAIKDYLVERGTFLKSVGIDGVIMGPWYWVNFGNYLGTAGMSSANLEMMSSLKQNFTGEIIYGASGVGEITAELNTIVDRYIYNQYVGFDSSTIASYSVDAVKSMYAQGISEFLVATSGKPLVIDASIQSRAGFFTYSPGYYDPFCTASGNNPCIQTTLRADFGLQAIFTEALLETSPMFGSKLGGVIMPYFVSPNLLPPASFYNQDATVRGKPAEYIFYKWFNQ